MIRYLRSKNTYRDYIIALCMLHDGSAWASSLTHPLQTHMRNKYLLGTWHILGYIVLLHCLLWPAALKQTKLAKSWPVSGGEGWATVAMQISRGGPRSDKAVCSFSESAAQGHHTAVTGKATGNYSPASDLDPMSAVPGTYTYQAPSSCAVWTT